MCAPTPFRNTYELSGQQWRPNPAGARRSLSAGGVPTFLPFDPALVHDVTLLYLPELHTAGDSCLGMIEP